MKSFTEPKSKKQAARDDWESDLYRIDPKSLWKIRVSGVFLCIVISFSFYDSICGFIFTLPILFGYVRFMTQRYVEKQRSLMEIQFKDAMVNVTSSLQAGYSLSKAFTEAGKVSADVYGKDAMITEILSRYVEGQKLNIPIDQLLSDMEAACRLEIVSELADIIKITRQYGGNLPDLIQKQTRICEENLLLKAEIMSATASLRYEAYIMDVIPVAMIWYLNLTGAGALNMLYHTLFGYVFMSVCLYINMAAVWWQFKITEKVTE